MKTNSIFHKIGFSFLILLLFNFTFKATIKNNSKHTQKIPSKSTSITVEIFVVYPDYFDEKSKILSRETFSFNLKTPIISITPCNNKPNAEIIKIYNVNPTKTLGGNASSDSDPDDSTANPALSSIGITDFDIQLAASASNMIIASKNLTCQSIDSFGTSEGMATPNGR